MALPPHLAGRLAGLAACNLDWDYLLRAAHRHGVLPLLHDHLRGLTAVPAQVRDRLHAHAQANAARSLLLTGELLQLLPLFAAHGVAALPFKGPTLAARAYGNVALREFGDLDLLLTDTDLPRARALLLARGYRVQYALPPRQEAAYVRSIRQLPLVRDDGCIVELHTALTPRAFRFPLAVANLWQRRVPLLLLGRPVPALAAEDLLLTLCMHGAKHRWENLGWVCDVAELLRACPAFDWPATLRRARQLRARRLLHLGLDLARQLLAAPVPGDVLRQMEADPVAGELALEVIRGLFADGTGAAAGVDSFRFHLRARERLGDGLRYCASLALEPTRADWEGSAAPSWLPLGDYLLRPVRLVGKYARAALQASRFPSRDR